MKGYIKYALLVIIPLSITGYATPLPNGSYWQCTTHDNAHKEWSAQNNYQKVAINLAFAACKKESQSPLTCKASINDCEGFNQGLSTRPVWSCTALDRTATPWKSNFYPQRDDAALAAKAYCKDNSAIPETCYINMVTCENHNPGVEL